MKTFLSKSYDIKYVKNRRLLYKFLDDSAIEFNFGSKDNYRVSYLPDVKNMNYGYSPRDDDYFEDLVSLKDKLGYDIVWNDCLIISDLVKENGLQNKGKPDYSKYSINKVESSLHQLVDKYPDNIKNEVFKLFFTLWSVMVSEWYYVIKGRPSVLKHTLKLIGMYQVLNNLYTSKEAAKFSKTDEMMNEFLKNNAPEFNLENSKSAKLKKIMDIYEIDYEWLK